MNGYISKNKLSGMHEGIFLFHTDSQASKRLTEYYKGREDEYEVLKTLIFEPDTGHIELCPQSFIDFPYVV